MKHLIVTSLAAMILACPVLAEDPAPQDAAAKLGWQLAVHSYTFQKFTLEQAIEMTQKVGIKYMSVSGTVNWAGKKTPTIELSADQIASVTKKLQSCGISPNFVNMGVVKPTADEAKSRKIFEFAKANGIGVLVAEPEPEALDVVEKLAKEFNIKVAFHNHPKPSRYWNPDVVLAAVKGRSPLLGSCADVGHWVRSGLDPIECLKKLEGRVICLHFKDLVKDGSKFHDVPWGTGNSNVKGMMTELKRQGFKGAFCVEYEWNWENSSPEIAQCAKYFNEVCAELAK